MSQTNMLLIIIIIVIIIVIFYKSSNENLSSDDYNSCGTLSFQSPPLNFIDGYGPSAVTCNQIYKDCGCTYSDYILNCTNKSNNCNNFKILKMIIGLNILN